MLEADEPVTLDHLADELLASCIAQLPLRSLPLASPVSRRWRDAARLAFAPQLRWRAVAHCTSLPLPIPSTPTSTSETSCVRRGLFLAHTRSGDLLVQLIDEEAAAVRTLCFANGASPEPYEAARRDFADHGPFNAGVGGVIGYRNADQGMAFFPAVGSGGAAASDSVWVASGEWQNVLHAGQVVFLLRSHANWWEDSELTADLLDTDTGGRAVIDVTPLRDALLRELASDGIRGVSEPALPARCAVSAADGHFVFHLNTRCQAKAAAALRLPAQITPPPQQHGPTDATQRVDAVVAFARCWPATHAIARLKSANEKPCGEYLMLWEDTLGSRHRPSALRVVLLHASTGVAVARTPLLPTGGPQHWGREVTKAFFYGGVGAIDFCPSSGVLAACSLPRAGLPPPAVLVWDWESAACLQAVLLHPLPPEPPPRAPAAAGQAPLRFPIGAQVRCRTGELTWLPGVVVDHHVDGGAPGAQRFPYQVRLDGALGELVFAPVDHPNVIKAAVDAEEVAWNARTHRMEVVATASLALHPSSSRLAIGMCRDGVSAGVVYGVDIRSA